MNTIMKLFVFELVHNFLMKYEICITYKILNLYCICRMPVGTSSISPITHYIIVTDKLNNIRLGSKLVLRDASDFDSFVLQITLYEKKKPNICISEVLRE